jgi:glycosyltransferase involved in cell wall biosynthesis
MSSYRIAYFSTSDQAGGAERIASLLHSGMLACGHHSTLYVGEKRGEVAATEVLIPGQVRRRLARFLLESSDRHAVDGRARSSLVARKLARLLEVDRWARWKMGIEDFDYPETRRVFRHLSTGPQLVHGHNLHGGYFDLRCLPWLSSRYPTVLTLHDEWLLTGHCAYTLGCQRWQTGCGQCPALETYPAVGRDATSFNLRRKRSIYQQSRLYLATPSRWLMERAESSILSSAILGRRVIPYGIELNVFCPGNREEAKHRLGIRGNALVVLCLANRGRANPFKDFETIEGAIARIGSSQPSRELIFLCVGQEAPTEWVGRTRVISTAYTAAREEVADYYRAADLFVHAAKTDNFPLTILEAMACGLPVVATAVGGIPEQVDDGETGWLVPPRDAETLATRISQLIEQPDTREAMGRAGAEKAAIAYSLERMVQQYEDWYAEILDQER